MKTFTFVTYNLDLDIEVTVCRGATLKKAWHNLAVLGSDNSYYENDAQAWEDDHTLVFVCEGEHKDLKEKLS